VEGEFTLLDQCLQTLTKRLGWVSAADIRVQLVDGVGLGGDDGPDQVADRYDPHDGVLNHDRQVAGRTHYYNRMGVSPDNPNEAYFLTSNWSKTLDGGATIIDPPFTEVPGGDHHDIWIDPTNGNRMVVSHDGGV